MYVTSYNNFLVSCNKNNGLKKVVSPLSVKLFTKSIRRYRSWSRLSIWWITCVSIFHGLMTVVTLLYRFFLLIIMIIISYYAGKSRSTQYAFINLLKLKHIEHGITHKGVYYSSLKLGTQRILWSAVTFCNLRVYRDFDCILKSLLNLPYGWGKCLTILYYRAVLVKILGKIRPE